jgi:hypothetical protein
MLPYRSDSLCRPHSHAGVAICVSACCCVCVRMLLYLSSYCIYVSSYCLICVSILLCLCPHVAIYAEAVCEYSRCLHRQHTSAYVSACCYICGSCARVFAASSLSLPYDFYYSYYYILYIYVSAHRYTCVLIMNMCPHNEHAACGSCARLSAAFSPWRASWPRSLTKASTWSRRRNSASSVNLSQL